MNTDTLLGLVEAKLLTLGYLPPDIAAVRETIRNTIESDPPEWEDAEEVRIAQRDLVDLVTAMGAPGTLATAATYQGGATPPPPPSGGQVLGDISSLIPQGPPPSRAGQGGSMFAAPPGVRTATIGSAGGMADAGKFAPAAGGAAQVITYGLGWAARNPRLARYGGWLMDAAGQALAYAGGYAAGQAMTGAAGVGTQTGADPALAGQAEMAGVGGGGGVNPEITVDGVVSNMVALAPYFRDIWVNRGVMGDAANVIAKALQYIMTGNANVTSMDRCNFVADRFAEKFPDVADAISQFQCGLAEGIGLTKQGELVFMALKLHHAGVSFQEVCARCRR